MQELSVKGEWDMHARLYQVLCTEAHVGVSKSSFV